MTALEPSMEEDECEELEEITLWPEGGAGEGGAGRGRRGGRTGPALSMHSSFALSFVTLFLARLGKRGLGSTTRAVGSCGCVDGYRSGTGIGKISCLLL